MSEELKIPIDARGRCAQCDYARPGDNCGLCGFLDPNRRPVPEAAPGGPCCRLDQEFVAGIVRNRSGIDSGEIDYTIRVECLEKLVGGDKANAVNACYAILERLGVPTPAPNREAELKVIEALLRECVKITAHIPKGTEPHGQSMDASIRMNDFRKFRIAVANALASLAQAEMKGEGA